MRRPSKSIGRTRAEVAIDDVSRDVSRGGDRRLWLLESCPACGASPGARCRPPRGASRQPILHVARGWRQRRCPVCQAGPGEACVSPSGRTATGPHAARRGPARGELSVVEEIWRALERTAATVARVRFAGGGARRASVETVVAAAGGGELARWRAGESELGTRLPRRCGRAMGVPRTAADHRHAQLERGGAVDHARGQAWERAFRRDVGRSGRDPIGARRVARRVAGVAGRASGVRALRRSDRAERPVGGALLLKALPSGRLARQATRALGTAGPGGAGALRVVRGSDAGGIAAGGSLLLKGVVGRPRRAPGLPKPGVAGSRAASGRADTSRDASLLGNPLSPGARGRAR